MTITQRRQIEHRRIARAAASDHVRANEPKSTRLNWAAIVIVIALVLSIGLATGVVTHGIAEAIR